MPVTVHRIVSEAGPVHSLPPLLASVVLDLVLVRVPVPLHVAEQAPLTQPPHAQSTEERNEVLKTHNEPKHSTQLIL